MDVDGWSDGQTNIWVDFFSFISIILAACQTNHIPCVFANITKLNMLPLGQTDAPTAQRFISLQHRPESWKHALWMMPPGLRRQPHISKPSMLTGQTHFYMPEIHKESKGKKLQLHPCFPLYISLSSLDVLFLYPTLTTFFFFFRFVFTTLSCFFFLSSLILCNITHTFTPTIFSHITTCKPLCAGASMSTQRLAHNAGLSGVLQ